MRATRILLKELLNSATSSVLIAGYRFDHGADILEPLHRRMRDAGVRTRLYLNIEQVDREKKVTEEEVARQVREFWRANWPFGDPRPQVFYDARVHDGLEWVSLHAKCVVVDERVTLITSSNFTERGQRRNVEIGVLLEEPALAESLVANFVAGDFLKAPDEF